MFFKHFQERKKHHPQRFANDLDSFYGKRLGVVAC